MVVRCVHFFSFFVRNFPAEKFLWVRRAGRQGIACRQNEEAGGEEVDNTCAQGPLYSARPREGWRQGDILCIKIWMYMYVLIRRG